jgi:DNA-3-methyladenine glycosylase I
VLESFQAGLSWEIILNKRENFRKAFSRFDPEKVAAYGEKMIDELVQDAGIVRNRKKILAAINNAQRFLEIADLSHSFCNYFWQFTDNKPIINRWKTDQNIPANTKLSDTISADMKKCGFKFFGTTVCYAHMQAVGMVNDHTVDCFRHGECEALA